VTGVAKRIRRQRGGAGVGRPASPLLMPMFALRAQVVEMVMRPARFGIVVPQQAARLRHVTGLTMKNVAMYSTLPFAFLGAIAMS